MSKGYLIFIIGAGMFGSMLSSAGSMNSASDDRVEQSGHEGRERPGASKRADRGSNANGDAIELKRQYDGHFYADVEVNGMTLKMLVDTGASGIALSRDDARRAGLAPSMGMYEVVGEGASGDVRGEYVMLDRIKLGETRAERVPAVVLDGGTQSLLGQSFLSKFASVEIRDDVMVLR